MRVTPSAIEINDTQRRGIGLDFGHGELASDDEVRSWLDEVLAVALHTVEEDAELDALKHRQTLALAEYQVAKERLESLGIDPA